MDFSVMRQRVTLDNPSLPTSDGDGAEVRLWPPDGGVRLGARLPAAVEPSVANQSLEHQVAKTLEGVGGFTVRLRYLPGVTLETRITWHDGPTDRTLWALGVVDEASRHAQLTLTCAERVT